MHFFEKCVSGKRREGMVAGRVGAQKESQPMGAFRSHACNPSTNTPIELFFAWRFFLFFQHRPAGEVPPGKMVKKADAGRIPGALMGQWESGRLATPPPSPSPFFSLLSFIPIFFYPALAHPHKKKPPCKQRARRPNAQVMNAACAYILPRLLYIIFCDKILHNQPRVMLASSRGDFKYNSMQPCWLCREFLPFRPPWLHLRPLSISIVINIMLHIS